MENALQEIKRNWYGLEQPQLNSAGVAFVSLIKSVFVTAD